MKLLEADKEKFYRMFSYAKDHRLLGCKDTIRFYKSDGTLTAFDMHISLDNEDIADLRISGYSIDDGEEVEIDDGQIDESFDYDEDLETINVRIYFEWYDVDDNSSSMDDVDDTEFVSENDEITITTNLSFEQRID